MHRFYKWCLAEILKEHKSIVSNGVYLENANYLKRLRIMPLVATAQLIYDLAEQAGLLLSNESIELFNQINQYRRK
ncbi:hypothetical protein [Caldithrix abyssi]|nr:hypothetical protein [Caldithrix abyssi]APF20374.1 hypothetical protein Cabys_3628 [Caldithrix abyssi DSM 13497]